MHGDVRHAPTGLKRWIAAGAVGVLAVSGFVAVASGPASSEAFPGSNGRIVYAVGNSETEESDLWTMDPDGSNPIQLTDAPDGAEDFSPQWSPDGTKVAFQRDMNTESDDDEQIWVVDADGAHVTQLTFNVGGASVPSWSPDSTKIVFDSWPPEDTVNAVPAAGSGPAIFIMDADGSNQTQLATENNWDRWPSWSPDGTKLTFTRDDAESGATEVWVIGIDGSNPTQLTDSGDSEIQSYASGWSPDGTKIQYLFRANDDDYYTYVMNADGSNQHSVAGPGSGIGRWSPDGQLILLTYWGGETPGIYTVGADGSNLTLVLAGENVWDPAWQTLPAVAPTTTTTQATNPIQVSPRYAG